MTGVRVRSRAGMVSASVAALMLAACGGGGGRGPVSTPPPPSPPAPAPVPTPTPSPPPTSNFNTAEYRRSNGPQQHGAITAWEAGRTGAGQPIAIIDTGIDANSPEFAGRILPASRDVTTGGRSIQAEDDHGTNVALVAAAARNGTGVMGIAFNAPLLVLRADTPGSCADSGNNTNEASCSFSDSSIARGIDAAVTAGARVINISLGGPGAATTAVRDAVARASTAGVVIVVAAGNGGTGNRAGVDPNQPNVSAASLRAAGGNNVIIVGSVDESNQISAFSQRAGNEAAWFLTARGERICCVYENGQIFVGQDADGAFNLLFSGTSFATPQVAGAVALLAQAFPNLSGQQIVRLLLDSARDAGAAGIDSTYGTGVLDIAAAFAPRGTMTLAGGNTVVRIGEGTATASPAMGDALGQGGGVQGVALDSYARAYEVDLASGMRGAALQDRLYAALGARGRVAATSAGPVALAFTIGGESGPKSTPGASPLQLTQQQAQGAQVLAARIAARIAPDTDMAFAVREAAGSLTAQLQGAPGAAFLIAREANDDSGFVRSSDASFALRRQFGATGVTFSAESGALWRGDNRTSAELLPGGPQARYPVQSFALTADRWVGPVDAKLGVTWMAEDASVMGALFAPVFGMRGADTLFLDGSAGYEFAGSWRLGAAWRQGWTQLRTAGLVASGSRFTSNGWSVDLSRTDTLTPGDSIGLRLSQPLRVSGGGIGLTLPIAYDYATLTPSFGTRYLPLAPSGREIDAELAWRGPLWGGNASASLFYRTDPGHYATLPDDKGVALRWSREF
jgi:subtilisin family serine protease